MKNLVFVNNKKHGEEASMVMQRTVNPPPWARLVRSQYSPPSIGLVVQLVRVPACHAGRCGFESRPDRQVVCTVRLSVRTLAFHASKRGSIPLRCTSFMSLWYNGITSVSKTADRGSIPWRFAKQ